MYSTIKAGGKEIPVVSNAATAFIFKQTFKEDLLTFIAKLEEHSDGETTEMMLKAFYVMAKQAEVHGMSQLLKSEMNSETFIEFISEFNILETGDIALQVFNVWNGNAETSVTDEEEKSSKKKTAKAAK